MITILQSPKHEEIDFVQDPAQWLAHLDSCWDLFLVSPGDCDLTQVDTTLGNFLYDEATRKWWDIFRSYTKPDNTTHSYIINLEYCSIKQAIGLRKIAS